MQEKITNSIKNIKFAKDKVNPAEVFPEKRRRPNKRKRAYILKDQQRKRVSLLANLKVDKAVMTVRKKFTGKNIQTELEPENTEKKTFESTECQTSVMQHTVPIRTNTERNYEALQDGNNTKQPHKSSITATTVEEYFNPSVIKANDDRAMAFIKEKLATMIISKQEQIQQAQKDKTRGNKLSCNPCNQNKCKEELNKSYCYTGEKGGMHSFQVLPKIHDKRKPSTKIQHRKTGLVAGESQNMGQFCIRNTLCNFSMH